MVDKCLSDSELLDFTDGGEVNFSTLPRHSHFFNSPEPGSSSRSYRKKATRNSRVPSSRDADSCSNNRRLSLSLPYIISSVEGRIHLSDPPGSSPARTVGASRRRGDLNNDDNETVFSFDNRLGLAHDLGFLATMPELCDVTFLVGEDRQPVCGVKAILAARSRVFRRLLYQDCTSVAKKVKKRPGFYRPSSDGFIEKNDFKGQPTIIIEDFQLEVFKQLMEYVHTGSVMLQSRTLLGLMNAADHYGLEDLKLACVQFLEQAINTDTVCVLLSTAEKYIQYKSTKILVQKMLEFVDSHAEVVLNLGSFSTLPQHVVRIVLGREELQASEETKFEAAFKWCLRYIDDHPGLDLKTAFEPFVSQIEFYKISAGHLMKNVKPAQVVDDTIILTALAYQADPNSVSLEHLNIRQKKQMHPSMTQTSIKSLDSSPPKFRRVKSSGVPIKSLTSDIGQSEVDGLQSRQERGGSVPPSEDRKQDLHPNRVFEIRVDSRTSELSLSTTGSTNSLSSGIPVSPVIIRSASSSSYQSNQSNEADISRNKKLSGSSNPEIYVTNNNTVTTSLV